MNRGGNKLSILVTLGLLFLATGCGVRVRMQKWIGSQESALRESMGPPLVVLEFPNGIRALRYSSSRTDRLNATPEVESRCTVTNENQSGEVWTCMGTHLLDRTYQESLDSNHEANTVELSSYERATYYFDEGGRVFLWTHLKRTKSGERIFRFGPREDWTVAALLELQAQEAELLRQQGRARPATRGTVRTDIFDTPEIQPKQSGEQPVMDFLFVDLPVGLYRAGDAAAETLDFFEDLEKAVPEKEPAPPVVDPPKNP